MRATPWLIIEPYRIQIPEFMTTKTGDPFGAFVIPYKNQVLRCIACAGSVAKKEQGSKYGWDHVSVSTSKRCPTWDEMNYIKDLFFSPNETVVQFHPAVSEYVNLHVYTLHLWRPLFAKIPLPPKDMV